MRPYDNISQPDNHALVEALAEGDMEAYKILFFKYYPTVTAFVRGMLHESQTAEDIAQNIFMKVWLNRERLDPTLSIKNYLLVLSKHEVYNHLRAKRTRMVELCEKLSGQAVEHDQIEERLSSGQLSAAIDRAVEQLPQRRRQIFRLSRNEYMSNREIAERLGLEVRTVDKHLELALRDIRRIIGMLTLLLASAL